ncbi:hypothetical protein [Polaribacter sp. SA4-12]|uniref:hypothetical protein n=1 Tax=Polaribacter sp. SA4-12 TaxID=1312072 RepID=UPI000B3D38C9|nr:hypothetical protein [Polaribacter sp. SA4-12]ARV14827.1 hypothetical protein BTO07_06535 [Polaribacter sp. SA4-12]
MSATDVYNIAKHLSKDELIKLNVMINRDLVKSKLTNTIKKPLPNFSFEDGIRYLLENHIKKS